MPWIDLKSGLALAGALAVLAGSIKSRWELLSRQERQLAEAEKKSENTPKPVFATDFDPDKT